MEGLKQQGYEFVKLSDGTFLRLSKKKHPEDGVLHLGEISLRRKKLALLQRHDGRILFHIRQFVMDTEGQYLYPSKMGVTLNLQQTRDLLEYFESLQEVVEDVSDFIFIIIIISNLCFLQTHKEKLENKLFKLV